MYLRYKTNAKMYAERDSLINDLIHVTEKNRELADAIHRISKARDRVVKERRGLEKKVEGPGYNEKKRKELANKIAAHALTISQNGLSLKDIEGIMSSFYESQISEPVRREYEGCTYYTDR